MMNESLDRVLLKLAGEKIELLYNRNTREVYNPLFPGIAIYKYPTNCGHILSHNELREIVENKLNEFELAIAKLQLNQAIEDFKDYSDSF
jgi:hypothetical protein